MFVGFCESFSKVFDLKQEGAAPDSIGAVYFFQQEEQWEAAIIHKEKYEGIQSAHRLNQPGEKNRPEQEEGGAAFSQGISL